VHVCLLGLALKAFLVVLGGAVEELFDPVEAVAKEDRVELVDEDSSVFHEESQLEDIVDGLVDETVLHGLRDASGSGLAEPVVGSPRVGTSH
jgi:hypothetical protein